MASRWPPSSPAPTTLGDEADLRLRRSLASLSTSELWTMLGETNRLLSEQARSQTSALLSASPSPLDTPVSHGASTASPSSSEPAAPTDRGRAPSPPSSPPGPRVPLGPRVAAKLVAAQARRRAR